MEMIEEIYANAEMMEDNRSDSSDSDHSYENVFVNQDHVEETPVTQRRRSFKPSKSSD
ncbi:C-type lectin domain family 4 member E-like isoform X1 [Clarias magur]|uniref:C-type lectin domain family 4 member E-like isoform X1 n=1 Tax=Clarias magur TaxID=1594786 RepID=A0A8J4TFA5_CLAMG|nr:C-type lectin domain family 4 member E-like isoform X1 [Clarias magur]